MTQQLFITDLGDLREISKPIEWEGDTTCEQSTQQWFHY